MTGIVRFALADEALCGFVIGSELLAWAGDRGLAVLEDASA
jgi:hypothetical protein